MATDFAAELDHKPLAELQQLPRSPVLSYLQKQSQPKAPRPAIATLAQLPLPAIGSFSPSHLWNFVVEYLRHRIGRKHAFQTYAHATDTGIYRMPADEEIRIALAGDWATGTYEAATVAGLIEGFQPHYAIHLGDVYYVGDPVEVNENFLGIPNPANAFKPVRWPSGTHGAFALNGNHEMYSLGTAYFDKMLPALGLVVSGRPSGQAASFFCLENEYWRIIALDTGYNSVGLPVIEYFWPPDCALPTALLDWLRDKVGPRDDDPRGIVILSHHQYYSRFDNWYPKPARQLTDFFTRPVLWFWGHEHRMAIYNSFKVAGGITAFGRCIGHGGMPVSFPADPPLHPECEVEFVDDRPYPNVEGLEIGFNGFARISLRWDRLNVEYVDVLGATIYSEIWTAQDGALRRLEAGAAP